MPTPRSSNLDKENFISQKREIQNYLLERERQLFPENMFVHSLFPGNCVLCEKCKCLTGKKCINQKDVRPSVDAIGIEMSSIADIDFNESVLYGMIFID